MSGSTNKKISKTETNSTVFNRVQRLKLSCPICPPNKGENAKRKARHGARKPRKKDKR